MSNTTVRQDGKEEDQFLFVKCFNENACLEGNKNRTMVNCDEGYEGVMCSACSDGFWKKLGNFECYPCVNLIGPDGDYTFKVLGFFMVTYMLARMFLGDFSKPNSETFATIKIMMTFGQTLLILSKMEQTRTKKFIEADLTSLIYQLVYYVNPGEWLFDFDCLLTSLDPGQYDYSGQVYEQKYLNRLLTTIFMPAILFTANVFIVWALTMIVKQCQFRKREDMRPLNCTRLFNRVSIGFGIQMFMVYPMILHLLFASMECFESLDPEISGRVV